MLLIALICAIFTGLMMQNIQTGLDRYVEGRVKSVRAITQVAKNQNSSQFKKRIKSLVNPETSGSHKKLLQAFARRDKEELLRLSLPFFETLRKESSHFATFAWITPDNRAFLRVHAPQNSGDNISEMRPDVAAANQTKQSYAGFTSGFYGIQYGIVQPVLYNGQHIGTVQFGLDGTLLPDLIREKLQIPVAMVLPNDVARFIEKSPLPSQSGKTHMLQARDIDLFSGIKEDYDWSFHQQQIILQGRPYILVKVLELNNFENKVQGSLVAALDISEEITRQNHLLLSIFSISAVILILSFLILSSSYGRLVQKIVDLNSSLEQNNRELENRVDERSRKLEKEMTIRKIAEEKAQRAGKMEAIGLMAGGVAHDLNNILSGIVSYPELLLLDMPRDSSQRKTVEKIQDSGKRAAAVVTDLLTVARGVASEKYITDMNDLIKEYLESPEFQQTQLHHPLVRCVQRYDPDLLNISCSPVHIKKCLMNLLNNGLEAMQDVGTISISTQNQYVDRPVSENQYLATGEYVVVSVADSGKGISKKDLEHIFEPFYTKKKMGRSGTGLGLAIVWNTMQDHGGAVTIASSHKGTRFDLYFPGVREDVSSLAETREIEELRGNGEQILVIDDEAQQRDVAVQMLSVLNYKAESVGSGEEAVEYVKENRVDLLLLDMVMDNGISGQQTYEQIAAISPGQKAIITSGFSETEAVEKTLELGANMFMRKPYTLAPLAAAVKQVLEAESADVER